MTATQWGTGGTGTTGSRVVQRLRARGAQVLGGPVGGLPDQVRRSAAAGCWA